MPNLIFILTDNFGAWGIGCYGNREIRTPNLDRLAAEGARFSRAYCVNSVCSPSRATFLTGLIPSQHGIHSFLTAGEPQIGPKAYCTIAEFRSLSDILAAEGYVCGLVGKWHLGDNLRPQKGFTAWLTTPHGHTTTFYDADVIENGQIRKEPQYLTDFWTDHAVRFIEQNKNRPFFLYLAYNGPYGLGEPLSKPARNRHAAYYADKELTCFPREPVHPWLVQNRQFVGNLQAMRRYAAEISGVDDGVGRVMDALRRLGLDRDTLVVFSADQGLCGGHGGFWGMGDHSRPIHTHEQTVRIPLLYRQPGRIPAGLVSDLMTCNYDFLPTVLSCLGLEGKVPASPPLPGRSYAGALLGQTIPWDNIIFHEFENTRMVRTADWKLTLRHPAGPDELYDMRNDPDERQNLIEAAEHAATRATLRHQMEQFFARYADPKYDLWRGGVSKARRLIR